jgi:hypothetical protein
MKNRDIMIMLTAMLLTLGCLAFSPQTQGVNPPLTPDPGPKPVSNTADGQNALLSISTGIHNTAVGFDSLLSNSDANFNTGVGSATLLLNNGPENTAVGAGALLSNTTGTDNTANGAFALFFNTATGNTAVGARALLNNTTGGILGNIQGIDVGPNVAVGWQALESNTVASANTAVGYQALQSFTTGPTGFEQVGACTAVGFQALANAAGSLANSAFGYQALMFNTIGFQNTANGAQALFSNTEGINNTANGASALFNNATGTGNTAIGRGALVNCTTGNFNTALGDSAGSGVFSASSVICIGTAGSDVEDSCYINNIFGQAVDMGSATTVFVDSLGKLGTVLSSQRFKRDIKPMAKSSESILALKPVTFHYKNDSKDTPCFGLIAEEVAEVNPDLIVRDKEGKPYTVRYDQVNAMLLNEFLKEHKAFVEEQRKVQEQGARITALKSKTEKQEATLAQQQIQMETMVARLNEQAAQIQKVSAQVKLGKSATKVAETGR